MYSSDLCGRYGAVVLECNCSVLRGRPSVESQIPKLHSTQATLRQEPTTCRARNCTLLILMMKAPAYLIYPCYMEMPVYSNNSIIISFRPGHHTNYRSLRLKSALRSGSQHRIPGTSLTINRYYSYLSGISVVSRPSIGHCDISQCV